MRSMIGLALSLALALALLGPAQAAEAVTDGAPVDVEDEFVRTINRERAQHGLPALRVSLQQHRKAREHSQRMRESGHLHHPADLGAEVFPRGAWSNVGENAARNRSVERAHRSLMDSPPHRRNLLGDWTHVAVGVAFDGRDIWITQRFVTVRPGRRLPMFTDMPSSSWKRDTVVAGWRDGLLAGCGSERVCPEGRISRAQMASLLVRAAGLEEDPGAAERFRDVSPRSVHAGSIGALAANGTTLGCHLDRYCPSDDVSRAATASLIVRANRWAPLPGEHFDDVPLLHTHGTTINRLAQRGVTDGCSSTRYCPDRPVSRVEAAALLSRAF